MRDAKRLAAIRKLPCVVCGRSPVDAAHSNQSNHGKFIGIELGQKYFDIAKSRIESVCN